MSATIIDGKKLAAATRAEIAAGVAALKAEKGVTPGLAVILVGDNPASVSYVTAKEKASREAGMHSLEIRLPADATEEQVRDELLNHPRKYPGWRELSRMLQESNAKAEKDLEDARRLVAARIRQEQTDLSKRGGSK